MVNRDPCSHQLGKTCTAVLRLQKLCLAKALSQHHASRGTGIRAADLDVSANLPDDSRVAKAVKVIILNLYIPTQRCHFLLSLLQGSTGICCQASAMRLCVQGVSASGQGVHPCIDAGPGRSARAGKCLPMFEEPRC